MSIGEIFWLMLAIFFTDVVWWYFSTNVDQKTKVNIDQKIVLVNIGQKILVNIGKKIVSSDVDPKKS